MTVPDNPGYPQSLNAAPILTKEWYCSRCEQTWPYADGSAHDCAKDNKT